MKALLFVVAALNVIAADRVDFRRDVRPILSNNCFHCHGPDKDTRLANPQFAKASFAVVPQMAPKPKPAKATPVPRTSRPIAKSSAARKSTARATVSKPKPTAKKPVKPTVKR